MGVRVLGDDGLEVGSVSGAKKQRDRDATVIDDGGEFGGAASAVGRIATNAIPSIDAFDVSRVNTVILGSIPPRVQFVQCLVRRRKDSLSRPASAEAVNGAVIVGTACLLEVPPCHA